MDIARVLEMCRNDDTIACPYCDHKHEVSDPDISSVVITYWGDDEMHNLPCDQCGKDFLVEENVTRKFTSYITKGA